MGLLGGLVLVFSISLLALFIPLLSKKTGENREDTAARQDIEQGAVEQVADAILYGNGSKKATHTLKLIST